MVGKHSIGGAYASRGKFYARPLVAGKRRSVMLPAVGSLEEARERAAVMAGVVGQLEGQGHHDRVEAFITELASAPAAEVAGIVEDADELCKGTLGKVASGPPEPPKPTFKDIGEAWTSGDLATRYPDHVYRKRYTLGDETRLAILYKAIGSVKIECFTLADARRAMGELTARRVKSKAGDRPLETNTRLQYAQCISRVLALSVFPLELIERSPIPKGFIPRSKTKKMRQFLYPKEEAKFLAFGKVPLGYRLLLGFLSREGMRSVSEGGALTWGDLDLDMGTINLRANKTDDPRAWVLGADVVRALDWWKKNKGGPTGPDDEVFTHRDGSSLCFQKLAAYQRSFLKQAGVTRRELFERTPTSLPIRAHDCRSTFVTLALASGKTETWVIDRTGHQSSKELNNYRRGARRVAELNLGWLDPLDQAIPVIAQGKASSGGASGGGSSPPSPSSEPTSSFPANSGLSHPSPGTSDAMAESYADPLFLARIDRGGNQAPPLAPPPDALRHSLKGAVDRGDLRAARVLLDELDRLETEAATQRRAAPVVSIDAGRKGSKR